METPLILIVLIFTHGAMYLLGAKSAIDFCNKEHESESKA